MTPYQTAILALESCATIAEIVASNIRQGEGVHILASMEQIERFVKKAMRQKPRNCDFCENYTDAMNAFCNNLEDFDTPFRDWLFKAKKGGAE